MLDFTRGEKAMFADRNDAGQKLARELARQLSGFDHKMALVLRAEVFSSVKRFFEQLFRTQVATPLVRIGRSLHPAATGRNARAGLTGQRRRKDPSEQERIHPEIYGRRTVSRARPGSRPASPLALS